MAKGKAKYVIIGYFDKKTRLIVGPYSFIIQECKDVNAEEQQWVSLYYYSHIGDAIRGYAKYAARKIEKSADLRAGMSLVLTHIKALEDAIAVAAKNIQTWWDSNKLEDKILEATKSVATDLDDDSDKTPEDAAGSEDD